MRMILAINNRVLEERITIKYSDTYNIYLAESTEIIYNLISNNEKCILIIKEDIKGKIEFKDLIVDLKKQIKDIQIIVLVKKLEQDLKEFLFSKEVFSIIEGIKLNLDTLVDLIENPQIVVYKSSTIPIKNNKVICVTGSRCVGKTIVSLLISNIIAKDKNKKVVVIDMNFVTPTLDTYLNLNKNYSLIDYISDLENKTLKDIKNYETCDSKYQNLKYILNSKPIPIPSSNTITNIINSLQLYYHYVIVDTSTFMINKIYSIAKQNNYNLLHIIEPSKKSFKEYLLDTIYIEKELLLYSYIICNKSFFKNKIQTIARDKNLNINGNVKFSIILSYNNKFNEKYLRYSLKYILKKLNINKLFKLKCKLIDNILKYKEDNYE